MSDCLVPMVQALVDDVIAGPCVALQVRGSSAGAVDHATAAASLIAEFRELCGPSDSEIARALRKNSLRAKFGVDKVCSVQRLCFYSKISQYTNVAGVQVSNAVHCTDLSEDGPLECAFFFDLLAAR